MYSIFGSIIDKDKNPKNGLKVVAYDDDPLWFDDKLGEDVTNEKGFFKIEFDKSSFDGFAEGRPDIFLVIKDANDKELLKTRVKKTKKQVEYHIKLAEHTPDPNALDIYAGNLSKVMKNFQNIGDFIDSENCLYPQFIKVIFSLVSKLCCYTNYPSILVN